MKRKIITLMLGCLTICATSTFAQVYKEGGSFIHGGIGFGSPFLYSGSKSGIPPVHASFEYGLKEKIGVGGLIGYTSSTWEPNSFGYGYSYGYKYTFSYIIIGARAAYHFYNVDKIDAYGGAMLGWNIASSKAEVTGSSMTVATPISAGGFAFGAFVGGRYMFTDKLGAFAELGYNIAWVSVGLAAKF